MAPAELGASRLAPDNKLLAYTPEQLAAEYGDILLNGDASPYVDHFDPENDLLRATFGAQYKADRRAGSADRHPRVHERRGRRGAVRLRDQRHRGDRRRRPPRDGDREAAEAGAALNPSGAVKALSGKQTTTKGIAADYGMQVLFYVPAVTATDQRVRVLGFTQGLVAAAEVA